VRDYLLAVAARQPLVLSLEDLHWADTLSVDLVTFLAEFVSRAPMLVLCSYRPEQDHSCRHLVGAMTRRGHVRAQEVRLSELSSEETGALVEALLPAGDAAAPLRARILERAHGNPFFVEEVVRSLIDTGVLRRTGTTWEVAEGAETTGVPETIQTVILSRVDRLPSELKAVLEQAAVIGRVFRPRILEYLGAQSDALRRTLLRLEEHGLIYQERVVPEAEFSFKHVLIQETIYDTVLRRRRTALHRQVAEAFETLYPETREDFYEDLAQHYSLGGAYAKAVDYLVRVGQRAKQLYANQEAVRHFERALRFIARLTDEQKDPLLELSALEGLGDAQFRSGAHHAAECQFQQALVVADNLWDRRRRANLIWKLADAVHWQGEVRRAIRVAQRGLDVLPEGDASPEAVNLLEVMMRSAWADTDLDEAHDLANRIRVILPNVPYFDSLYTIYYGLAWLEIKSKNYDEARRCLEAAEQLCLAHKNESGLARCYHGLGDLARGQLELEPAIEYFRRSLTFCERTGEAHLLMEGHLEMAQLLITLGRPDEEFEPHLERGLRIADDMARTGGVSSIQALCSAIANSFSKRGDPERAIWFFRRAFDFGPHPFTEQVLVWLERLYQEVDRPEELAQFRAQVLV
jgi:predicted ATPase